MTGFSPTAFKGGERGRGGSGQSLWHSDTHAVVVVVVVYSDGGQGEGAHKKVRWEEEVALFLLLLLASAQVKQ